MAAIEAGSIASSGTVQPSLDEVGFILENIVG